MVDVTYERGEESVRVEDGKREITHAHANSGDHAASISECGLQTSRCACDCDPACHILLCYASCLH